MLFYFRYISWIVERLEKEEYFAGSGAESASSNDPYEKEDYNGLYDNNSYKRSYSKLNDENVRSPSLINSMKIHVLFTVVVVGINWDEFVLFLDFKIDLLI